jgi:hypothetical protein
MRDQHIKIESEQDRRKALHVIQNLDISTESPLEVRVTAFKAKRSTQQNRLYRKWCSIIAHEIGEASGEDVHEQMKYKFAVNILIRDDEQYAEGILSLKAAIARADEKEAESLRRFVLRLTSTTVFGVRQMSEYMLGVQTWAADMGIVLPE